MASVATSLELDATGQYACLLLGALLESATSAWIRWRLGCELEDGTGPARLRTFRQWLLSTDDYDDDVFERPPEKDRLLPEESKELFARAEAL